MQRRTFNGTPRSGRSIRLVTALLGALVLSIVPAPVAFAASIRVTTTADELNNDGDCSLREAIRAANLDTGVDACAKGSGADTITLRAATYTLTIPGPNEDAGLTGDLDVFSDLNIRGAGAAATIVDGGGQDRVLHFPRPSSGGEEAVDARISGITIRNGRLTTLETGDAGAGILNDAATVYLVGSTVTQNVLEAEGNTAQGAGIANRGRLFLNTTLVSDNLARATTGLGGGIFNFDTGTLIIGRSQISANEIVVSVGSRGGGIYNAGSAKMTLTTVEDNVVEGGGDPAAGGGVLNTGKFVVSLSRIQANRVRSARSEGGGFFSSGTLVISFTEIAANQVQGSDSASGGGVFSTGNLTLAASSVHDNVAIAEYKGGGGISNIRGVASIRSSAVYNNRSGGGGGIRNFEGTLSVTNSTISGNQSGPAGSSGFYGSSLENGSGSVELTNVTISADGKTGGTISNIGTGSFTLRNSIIVDQAVLSGETTEAPTVPCATLVSQGYNLVVGIDPCAFTGDETGNLYGVDPQIGPLQDNGGPTFTHALLPGSPAIDAGTDDGCPTTDQRGVMRPQGTACDIGAYEAGSQLSYNACPLYNPTKAVNAGKTIEIKLQLCDANRGNASSPSIVVQALKVTHLATDADLPVQAAGNAHPDDTFRYDAALGGTGGYIYNLSTKGFRTGRYALSFTVDGDPAIYTVEFRVK